MILIQHWQLIKHLTLREIRARYKQSFLGFLWVILNPVFQMVILSFVFSFVVRFPNLGVPYPIFLFVGLLPWIFFDTSIGASINTLEAHSSLIKQVYFPREVLILSTIFAKMIDFFLAGTVLIILMIFYQIDITGYALLFFPIFLVQLLFMYGLSLLLSSLNLFYRDVQHLFNLVIRLWFYITPVLYPVELFPEKWRFIFKFNPMSVFINAYRQTLLAGDAPKFSSLFVGILMSAGLYIIAYSIFKKLEGTFADVV